MPQFMAVWPTQLINQRSEFSMRKKNQWLNDGMLPGNEVKVNR